MTFLIDIGEDYYWDWIQDNWKTIRCAELVGPGLAFEAALAVRRFDGKPWSIWRHVLTGLVSASEFVGCMLSEDDVAAVIPDSEEQCQAVRFGGQLTARIDAGLGAVAHQPFGDMQGAKQILDAGYTSAGNAYCKYKSPNEGEFTETVIRQEVYEKFDVRWYIKPAPGDSCVDAPLPPLVIPDPPPPWTIHQDSGDSYGEHECGKRYYEVRPIDAALDARGLLWVKHRIYGVGYENPECTSRPSVYPQWQCYWESSAGVIWVNCDEVGLPFQQFVERPNCNPGLSAVTYKVSAGCTWNEEEGRYETVYEAPVMGTDNGVLGLAWRLDALAWLLEKVNLIPYGICGTEKPELAAHWRSLTFESEDLTPNGKRRAVKRFRYRGAQPGQLDALARHWKDFEWTTGPVIVQHKGSPVGTPQVWASSEEEGKRVIRHAFREAGFDADQIGEWGVSGCDNGRYGVSLRVRLKCVDGAWSATSRPSPSGYPEAPIVFPDP